MTNYIPTFSRRTKMRTTKYLFAGCLLSTSILAAANSWGGEMEMYKITVTNLNPGQPLAPVMAASHRPGITFFKPGLEQSCCKNRHRIRR